LALTSIGIDVVHVTVDDGQGPGEQVDDVARVAARPQISRSGRS